MSLASWRLQVREVYKWALCNMPPQIVSDLPFRLRTLQQVPLPHKTIRNTKEHSFNATLQQLHLPSVVKFTRSTHNQSNEMCSYLCTKHAMMAVESCVLGAVGAISELGKPRCFSNAAQLAEKHPRVMAQPVSTVFHLLDCLRSAAHDLVPFATGMEQGQLFGFPSWITARFLALIEMPQARFWELPFSHADLLSRIADARAVLKPPAQSITATMVLDELLTFVRDEQDAHVKRRWLCIALQVPRKQFYVDGFVDEILEKSVDHFFALATENALPCDGLSTPFLAVLSLYVCLLQSKRSNPFTPAQPLLLLQQSILGVGRKSYVPAELVSSPDVLPLQGFPKYWYDLAESSEFLPAADPLKCPIASPPVTRVFLGSYAF